MSGSTPSHETDRGAADQRLAQAVSVSIRRRCGRWLTGLAAVARQGVVTLHGRVRGYYQKQVMLDAGHPQRGGAIRGAIRRSQRGVKSMAPRLSGEVLQAWRSSDQISRKRSP